MEASRSKNPELFEGRVLRRWERRFTFTLELFFKTAWGWLIEKSSQATYEPEDQVIQVWVKNGANGANAIDPRVVSVNICKRLLGRMDVVS